MEDYRIVVDQSTSGTKVLLVKTTGDNIKIINRVDKAHKQIYPNPGWVEHDPIEIIENVNELITKVLMISKVKESEILSLSIVNQRETVVIWDKKTGKPLMNALVWQCNRGGEICENLINDAQEEIIQSKTGLKIDTYFSGSKLKWFFTHHNVENATDIAIGTMDSWLIWNLTNKEIFATEPSNASRTLLYNIHTQQWDEDLCKLFNTPITGLPEIRSTDASFGFYKGIPIIGVMGDSQAALYGQNLIKKGDVKATLGTGCSVLMHNGENHLIEGASILRTVAWRKNDETSYALEGIIRSCTDTLNWMSNELGFFSTVEEGSDMAFSIPDSGSVYLIPAQLGLATPFWKSDATASFVGMTRSSTKTQLIRAAFDSIAFQIKAVIDELEKNAKTKIESIKVDGGASKNKELLQLIADTLQKKIITEEIEEMSALGVLLMSFDINRSQKNQKVFEPKKDNKNQYNEWLKNVDKI